MTTPQDRDEIYRSLPDKLAFHVADVSDEHLLIDRPHVTELFHECQRLRAENERLRAWLDPIMEAYNDFEDFDFTSKSASMELALRRAFVDWHEAYRPSNK